MTVLLKTWAVTAFKQTHTHPFNGPFPGLPRWASTRKVTPIWILQKQETVSGSGISWAICKSAPYSRQTTTPAPHHSVFYRPDALPAAQPTASKHWRQTDKQADKQSNTSTCSLDLSRCWLIQKQVASRAAMLTTCIHTKITVNNQQDTEQYRASATSPYTCMFYTMLLDDRDADSRRIIII